MTVQCGGGDQLNMQLASFVPFEYFSSNDPYNLENCSFHFLLFISLRDYFVRTKPYSDTQLLNSRIFYWIGDIASITVLVICVKWKNKMLKRNHHRVTHSMQFERIFISISYSTNE